MVTKLVAIIMLNFDNKFRCLEEFISLSFHIEFSHCILKCDNKIG